MTRPPSPPLAAPAGRLRLSRPRWGLQAWLSLLAHAVVVAALAWRGHALVEGGGGGAGPKGGGGGERTVHLLQLPAAPPMTAVELPDVPRTVLSTIPPLEIVSLELTRMDLPLPAAAAETHASGAGGPGTGGGQGGGAGPGIGTASGPGTGGEAGYIFPPSPRGVIVPPDKAPKSVKGRKYRATFWVGADGRVQRVEVSPEIRDAEYRDALHDRLMDFAFYPARDRVGIAVPGVVPIDFAIP